VALVIPQIRPETTLLEFYRQLMAGAPILNGKHLDCEVTSGGGVVQTFAHGLGRMPQGVIVVASTDTTLFAQGGALDAEVVTLSLSAPADATVKVWIY
jgi:hypothetical protein